MGHLASSRFGPCLSRSLVSPLAGGPGRVLNLIMLAASSFLINVRVCRVAFHTSEPDDAASRTLCLMLERRRPLSLPRHYDLYLHVTHNYRWQELCWRRLFGYLLTSPPLLLLPSFLGGVKTSLSFATSCILFAHTSSHLSSLASSTGPVMAHTGCSFP